MSPHIEQVYFPLYEGVDLPRNYYKGVPSRRSRSTKTRTISNELVNEVVNGKKTNVNYCSYNYVYHKSYIPLNTWGYTRRQQRIMKKHNIKNIYLLSHLDNSDINWLEKMGKIKCVLYTKILRVIEMRRFIRKLLLKIRMLTLKNKKVALKKYWTDKIRHIFYTSKLTKMLIKIKKNHLKK